MRINIKSILKSISIFLVDNFRQSQHLEYRLLKRGHLLYQHEVKKQDKLFDIYINDYLSEIQNFPYKSPKELQEKTRIHSKVSNLFLGRPDLILKYFDSKTFNFQDYKNLINKYNTTIISPIEEENEESTIFAPFNELKFYTLNDKKIENELRKFVLECYENGTMHLGDRNFGYFLKHKHPAYSTTKQYTEAWTLYIGKYEPRDNCKYISDPSHWKNISEIDATLKSLERIENFYSIFMQEDSPIIRNIQRDKSKLLELKK